MSWESIKDKLSFTGVEDVAVWQDVGVIELFLWLKQPFFVSI